MNQQPTIYFFSGKMGAGKTTYATQLAKEKKAVLLSEDEILSSFYPVEIKTFEDYITYSKRIKPYLMKFIKQLVDQGNHVVMDFPGNTIKQRSWFLQIIHDLNVSHELLYLDCSDDVCLSQIQKRRNDDPSRESFDTEEVFHQVTTYFQKPTKEEGFHIKHIIRT